MMNNKNNNNSIMVIASIDKSYANIFLHPFMCKLIAVIDGKLMRAHKENYILYCMRCSIADYN